MHIPFSPQHRNISYEEHTARGVRPQIFSSCLKEVTDQQFERRASHQHLVTHLTEFQVSWETHCFSSHSASFERLSGFSALIQIAIVASSKSAQT